MPGYPSERDKTKLISHFVHDHAFGFIFDADVKKAGFGLTRFYTFGDSQRRVDMAARSAS